MGRESAALVLVESKPEGGVNDLGRAVGVTQGLNREGSPRPEGAIVEVNPELNVGGPG